MTTVTACRTCGTKPLENARFCHGCGSPVADCVGGGLRTLQAKACGGDAGYRDQRGRYRAVAASLGFEGHMQWAEALN